MEETDERFQHYFAVFQEGIQSHLFYYKLNKELLRIKILKEE